MLIPQLILVSCFLYSHKTVILKILKVPVFKKGDKNTPSNYLPVSLTCILCQILEHIIQSSIIKHLDTHKILTDSQHGFRAKRSCETQLILTLEDILKTTSKGKQIDIALLDFSKSFR
jgi:hypothetical protein